MATATELNRIYLAYFGRPADPGGVAFYANGPVAGILASFNGSAESRALYGTAFDATTVNTIYLNLFGRSASAAEAAAWVAIINAPGGGGAAGAAYTILQNAANGDLVALTHKLAINAAFTAALDTPAEIAGYQGAAAARVASDFLKTVDASDASLAAAQAQLEARVAAAVAAGSPAPASVPDPDPTPVFNLTLGSDTIAGTVYSDTFVAARLLDNNSVLQDSLQGSDSLTGRGGSDTLDVTLGGGGTVAPTLVGIANVQLRSTAAGSTLGLVHATGVVQATIANSSAAGAITGLAGVGQLAVANQTANASFGGITASTLALGLTSVGTSGGSIVVDLGAGGASIATTLNITASNAHAEVKNAGTSVATAISVSATGTNELRLTEGQTTATALTVTGTGSVNFDTTAIFLNLQTLAAGGLGGAISININNAPTAVETGAGGDTVLIQNALSSTASVNLGSGDDKLSLTSAPAAGVTLAGGAGTDILALTRAGLAAITGFGTPDFNKVTGFEILDVSSIFNTTASYDMARFTGLSEIRLDGNVVGANITATFANVAAGLVFKASGFSADSNNTQSIHIEVQGATTGHADALSINLEHASANSVAYPKLVTEGIETLTIGAATGPSSVLVLGLADADLQTLNVIGSGKLRLPVTPAMTHLATIDATASTSPTGVYLELNAAANQVITVLGTQQADYFETYSNALISGKGGTDFFGVYHAPASSTAFTTITDFSHGEQIGMLRNGNETFNTTMLAGQATLADYLVVAMAGNGSVDGIDSYFQLNGTTYLVQDHSAAATFVNGTDVIVALTGTLDLHTMTKTTATGPDVLTYTWS